MTLTLFMLLAVFHGATGSLTIKPRNTVAVAGQSVTINCKSNLTSPVAWAYVSVFFSLEPSITNSDGTVNTFYSSRNITLNDSNLVIGSVRLSDAGTYTCRENAPVNPDKSAAMLYVVDAVRSKCDVNKTSNSTKSVRCQVRYNGTDVGTDAGLKSRENYMYPVSEWTGCNFATNQSATAETFGQYNQTYITKADLSAITANTTVACVLNVKVRAKVIDPYVDKSDPDFAWIQYINNSTAWFLDDSATMTTTSSNSDAAVVGMVITAPSFSAAAATGYYSNTSASSSTPGPDTGAAQNGRDGAGLSLWSPSLLYSLLLVSLSLCSITSLVPVDFI